ncbi:MAG: DUF3837 domain-containing protein [Roseburia sp.]|nr:DUF3837 domain-containing protein [Roseburia sp.]
MVTSIARQSVIIKCNMQKSILTGNYEFYYAAGLVSKLFGVVIADDIQPAELFQSLTEKLETLEPRDEKEGHLFQMIRDYRPGEMYDEQMKELLLWGKNEQYLWTVGIPS